MVLQCLLLGCFAVLVWSCQCFFWCCGLTSWLWWFGQPSRFLAFDCQLSLHLCHCLFLCNNLLNLVLCHSSAFRCLLLLVLLIHTVLLFPTIEARCTSHPSFSSALSSVVLFMVLRHCLSNFFFV